MRDPRDRKIVVRDAKRTPQAKRVTVNRKQARALKRASR